MNNLNLTTFNFFLLFLIFSPICYAQNDQGSLNDESRINLNILIPEDTILINSSVEKQAYIDARFILENKLQNLVSSNGFSGSNRSPRFMIYPRIVVYSYEITQTAPVLYVYDMEVVFSLADYEDKRTFSTMSIPLKGVGRSPSAAMTSALKRINSTEKVSFFLDEGKKRIIKYYNDQCEFILKEAEVLAKTDEYEAAFKVLLQVPQACKECYMEAINRVPDYYKQFIDSKCDEKIYQATVLWASKKMEYEKSRRQKFAGNNDNKDRIKEGLANDKDVELSAGYSVKDTDQEVYQAVEKLLEIPANTDCYPKAKALIDDIKQYIGDQKEFNEREKYYQELALKKDYLQKAREIADRQLDYNSRIWENKGHVTIQLNEN